MSEEKPLPPKEKLELADVSTKMMITITCPYCKHKWDIIDEHDDDCSKMDPLEIVTQCIKCKEWMKTYDDDTAIEMFYEDEGTEPQWWEKEDEA